MHRKLSKSEIGVYLNALCWDWLLHQSSQHLVALFVIQMAEEEIIGNRCLQPAELFRGLLVERRGPVVV